MELPDSATVGDLLGVAAGKCGVPAAHLKALAGFPRPVQLRGGRDASLASAGVRSGERLVVQELTREELAAASKGNPGPVVRRKVADDNSCMFAAVAYAVHGGGGRGGRRGRCRLRRRRRGRLGGGHRRRLRGQGLLAPTCDAPGGTSNPPGARAFTRAAGARFRNGPARP